MHVKSFLMSSTFAATLVFGLAIAPEAQAQAKAGETIRFFCDSPILKTHTIPVERVDIVVTALETAYKGTARIRAWKLGNDRVMVFATVSDHEEVAKLIRKRCASGG
jgi:hypothetical protein